MGIESRSGGEDPTVERAMGAINRIEDTSDRLDAAIELHERLSVMIDDLRSQMADTGRSMVDAWEKENRRESEEQN